MKVMIASPEAVPYVKTGGLADVAGALCKEYRKMGEDAHLILPFYKKIRESGMSFRDTGVKVTIPVGQRNIAGQVFTDDLKNYFIRGDEFFDRQELYGTPEGDYGDNASRFIFFARGILETCKALSFKPDIIHCNDWQTGLVPLYLRTLFRGESFFKGMSTFLTIHNIGYQGTFPASEMPLTNLGWELFTPEGIEFYGRINFLKAGLISADVVTTVSSTYAREIFSKEFSFGLDGVLKTREHDMYGVINGIDHEEWDPSKDVQLPAVYNSADLRGKAVCKRELLKQLFPRQDVRSGQQMPLIGLVGRLSEQKGLDLIMRAVPELSSFGVKLAMLGKGDESFQRQLSELAVTYKDAVSLSIGFDDTLAHRIYAGSDFFLMPSKYEPCGLGQLIALRYGTIPIVRRTGGLKDTVQDYDPLHARGTGFLFSDYTPAAMLDAMKRAFCVYTDPDKMRKMILDGMNMDFSWRNSAEKYIELYKQVLRRRKQ